jgi:hypothetical protein
MSRENWLFEIFERDDDYKLNDGEFLFDDFDL